jgi:7-cyano-7-deazaguanine synthase
MTSKAVVVLSGGLDSTTLMHHVANEGWDIYAISFNYGQRHGIKELQCARRQTNSFGDAVEHHIVDLMDLTELFKDSGSALVAPAPVPEGHYGEESMKATVVPNRNMIMTSIAAGYAVSIGADKLALGVHAGDHYIYPDCRPRFWQQFAQALYTGNEGFLSGGFHVDTPFINWSKNDIAQRAFDLNVDIAGTWSCYKGGEIHCGKCGTCVERLEAIASTGNADPTVYEDDQFWKDALKRQPVSP